MIAKFIGKKAREIPQNKELAIYLLKVATNPYSISEYNENLTVCMK